MALVLKEACTISLARENFKFDNHLLNAQNAYSYFISTAFNSGSIEQFLMGFTLLVK